MIGTKKNTRYFQHDMDFLKPHFGRPHVFLLGAGASLAAFPEGDRNGKKLPLMNNLIDILGLNSLLKDHNLEDYNNDFEALYSMLATSNNHDDLIQKLEDEVFNYFSSLNLPAQPTLYDHLVLSLRNKDLIATFNWDPLLWQSMGRIARFFGKDTLPPALFLHGNIAISYCDKHKPRYVANRGGTCGKCGAELKKSELLYPVQQKNYKDNSVIKSSWRIIQGFLKEAFIFTIFGYSAPNSDVKASSLLKGAWGNADERNIEQIEIIDIRNPEELHKTWKPFICKDHAFVRKSFYNTIARFHPRRSCEDFWSAIMDCDPQPDNPIPVSGDWDKLFGFFEPLLKQEKEYEKERTNAKKE